MFLDVGLATRRIRVLSVSSKCCVIQTHMQQKKCPPVMVVICMFLRSCRSSVVGSAASLPAQHVSYISRTGLSTKSWNLLSRMRRSFLSPASKRSLSPSTTTTTTTTYYLLPATCYLLPTTYYYLLLPTTTYYLLAAT